MTCYSQVIEDLSWKYLRMYPVRDIAWESFKNILTPMECDLSKYFQQQVFDCSVNHPVAERFPPTKAYTQLFLKTLIDQIESCNQEVYEDLYCTYTGMLSKETQQDCDFCYKTYKQKSGIITLKETCNIVCDGTTGMRTWEASHFLAEWCSENASYFQRKSVLELGSGLGLTGLAVVQNCKPSSYTFTDVHDSVLKTLLKNVNINLSNESPLSYNADDGKYANDLSENFQLSYHDTSVQIKKLDWACDTYDSDVDIVVAADVVYDPDVIPHFVKILKDVLCRKPGMVAYVASTVRNPDTFACFRNELESKGLVVTTEAEQQHQDSPSQPEVSISLLNIKSQM